MLIDEMRSRLTQDCGGQCQAWSPEGGELEETFLTDVVVVVDEAPLGGSSTTIKKWARGQLIGPSCTYRWRTPRAGLPHRRGRCR